MFISKVSFIFIVAAALLVMGAVGSAVASALPYSSNGFESPTFQTGPISGQDGWTDGAIIESGIAESGNQAMQVGDDVETGVSAGVYGARDNIFDSTALKQTVSFDIRLNKTVAQLATGSTSIGMQYGMLFRGPTTTSQIELDYRGTYDGNNQTVGENHFRLDAASGWLYSPGLEADTWYHVTLNLDYAKQTMDANILKGGQAWWDTGVISNPFSSGSLNSVYLSNSGQAAFYLDNLTVTVPEPASAALLLLGLGGLLMLPKRRKATSC